MPEPKVVSIIMATGKKIYWCRKYDRQMVEDICRGKYFSRSSRPCRACLGIAKGKHWPDPWSSLGKEDEQINTVEIDASSGPGAQREIR